MKVKRVNDPSFTAFGKGKVCLISDRILALLVALEDVPLEDARYQFEVNVFGLSRLIQLVLPHMHKQRSGTIINISSVAGKVSSPLAGWYHASKHALETISDSLRMEVKQFGIKVVVIEPGAVKSEWGSIALNNAMKMSGNGAYKKMTTNYVNSVTSMENKASDPAVITKLLHKAIHARRPNKICRWFYGQTTVVHQKYPFG